MKAWLAEFDFDNELVAEVTEDNELIVLNDTAADEAEAAKVSDAKESIETLGEEELDLHGGNKTQEEALNDAIAELDIDEEINVVVDGTEVTISLGEAEETVTIANEKFDTSINITQLTLQDYLDDDDNVVGKSITFGIDKTRSIAELPAGTTISLFGNDDVGYQINTLDNDLNITRGDATEAWGTSTTFLFSNDDVPSEISDYWTVGPVANGFDNESELDYITIKYTVDSVDFIGNAWFN